MKSKRLSRIFELGSMAGKLAGNAIISSGSLLKGEGFHNTLHNKTAETLLNSLGELKGLPMKIGQILSYMEGAVPTEYKEIYHKSLNQLQVMSHPLSWEDFKDIFERDLKKSPEDIFAEFDYKPIAAASIGQVYLAKLKSGEKVAVKIQYPEIAKALDGDLKNVNAIISALTKIIPGLEIGDMVKESTNKLKEECDYNKEIEYQQTFRKLWENESQIYIPKVYKEFSTSHILVTEYVKGLPFDTITKEYTSEQKNNLGKLLFNFVFKSIIKHGYFNGDPHPGNFIFMNDNQIACLDFGCVQQIKNQTRQDLNNLIFNIIKGTRGKPLWKLVKKAIGISDTLNNDMWEVIEKTVLCCFEPIIAEQPYKFSDEYTKRIIRVSMQAKIALAKSMFKSGKFSINKEGIDLLSRAAFGLNSLLVSLKAEADWVKIIYPNISSDHDSL